jgi:hypothetical protein
MMINETLLRLVPPILRAREFRLYTRDGRRLVDLWQHGGAAILGRSSGGILRVLKNSAQRGLFTPLPHPQEGRFLKALSTLLPGMDFRLYRSDTVLCRAFGTENFPDPALFPDMPPPAPILWRPFLDSPISPDRPLIPVLPLPWPAPLRVLALPPAFGETTAGIPDSQLIAPLTLAAATRGVYDLIAATPARGRVIYPRIEEALAEKKWPRRGIYLSCPPDLDDKAYGGIFMRFLEQGFLLPPSREDPLILPGILSPGEETRLSGLLRENFSP